MASLKPWVVAIFIGLVGCQSANGDEGDRTEHAKKKKKKKSKKKKDKKQSEEEAAAPAASSSAPAAPVVDDGLETVTGTRFSFTLRMPRGWERDLDRAEQEDFHSKMPDGGTIVCSIDKARERSMPETESAAIIAVHVEGYTMKPSWTERLPGGGWSFGTPRVKGVFEKFPEMMTGTLRADSKGTVWRAICHGSNANGELLKKAVTSFTPTG
jgi:hypothetical protein